MSVGGIVRSASEWQVVKTTRNVDSIKVTLLSAFYMYVRKLRKAHFKFRPQENTCIGELKYNQNLN